MRVGERGKGGEGKENKKRGGWREGSKIEEAKAWVQRVWREFRGSGIRRWGCFTDVWFSRRVDVSLCACCGDVIR